MASHTYTSFPLIKTTDNVAHKHSKATKDWNIAQSVWTKPSSLGDSSPGGYLTSRQDHRGHIFLTEIIALKCPITHAKIPQLSPNSIPDSEIQQLYQSINATAWQLLFSSRGDCKFENESSVEFRPRQILSFPRGKNINKGEREARTTYSAGQIDSETNSVKIDWRVAWKRPAWDLWSEDTSQQEKQEDKENYGESEEFSFF